MINNIILWSLIYIYFVLLFEGLRAADDPTTFVRLNWIDVFLFRLYVNIFPSRGNKMKAKEK
jgi:hypothetical protein